MYEGVRSAWVPASDRRDVWKESVKRALDVLFAVAGLIVALPLMITVALLIHRTDGGPILFSQSRIGRFGRPFRVLKFRTMVKGADVALAELLARDPDARAEWEAYCKLRNDPRVIAGIGTFLRRTSLDELPQLFNVIRGEMSVVGPRPVEEVDLARYGDLHTVYSSVRPGLTGPWQISGRSERPFEERVRLDVEYICAPSNMRDISIMLRTVLVVVRGRGAY
jgi:exopolysaccharide production protein ExoY